MKPFLSLWLFGLVAVASLFGEEAKPAEPTEVVFSIPAGGWTFIAKPDGSVFGQYGSTAGDCILLPPGTADFKEMVALVKAAADPVGKAAVAAAVRHRDEVAVTTKLIEDRGYFRELFLKNRDRWRDWRQAAPNARLLELMEQIEYYRKPNPTPRPNGTRLST